MKMIGATLGIVLLASTAHAKQFGPMPTGSDGRWSTGAVEQTAARGKSIRHRTHKRRPLHGYTKVARRHHGSGRSVTLAGVVSPLADKAREIVAACGSTIISARNSRRNRSNHPIGRAVDIQGNPSCIYAHLAGWPGGYSTDYHTAPNAPHVHISYNPHGMEWGLRFAHRHYRTRYAYARRHRYARI